MDFRQKANNQRKWVKIPFTRFSLFSRKPPLSKLYIEPTTHCNLKCRTCIRNSWDEPEGSMDIHAYRNLLSDLKKLQTLETIAFWGIGEPLAHPEIVDMVARAHETGLKTEMITNGHLLDKDKGKGLIQAGLDTLVVSIDGTTEETFMDIRQGGDLLQVENNIMELNSLRKKMSKKNPDVGMEFVIMKSNIDQLPGLARRAKSMEIGYIILTNLLPSTEDMKDEILYWMSATLYGDDECSKWSQELMLPNMDLRPENLKPIQDLLKKMDSPMPQNRDITKEYFCPFVQKGAAAITWSGDVSPCIALMHSYNCYILGREKFIKRYLVGNITRESIGDIWNKNNYRSFRERVLKFDFSPCLSCGGCDFNETNEEDCFGNTHPVCGDCLWARSILLCP
jgi:tungsten cofactor oxidoreducase radical SAM maturase